MTNAEIITTWFYLFQKKYVYTALLDCIKDDILFCFTGSLAAQPSFMRQNWLFRKLCPSRWRAVRVLASLPNFLLFHEYEVRSI